MERELLLFPPLKQALGAAAASRVVFERILHRQRLAEGLGVELLEYGAHDVRWARLDPLLGLVNFVLVASLEEPVADVVAVQRQR
eukprot:2229291-Alexandrium_andersonii.AAC.1